MRHGVSALHAWLILLAYDYNVLECAFILVAQLDPTAHQVVQSADPVHERWRLGWSTQGENSQYCDLMFISAHINGYSGEHN